MQLKLPWAKNIKAGIDIKITTKPPFFIGNHHTRLLIFKAKTIIEADHPNRAEMLSVSNGIEIIVSKPKITGIASEGMLVFTPISGSAQNSRIEKIPTKDSAIKSRFIKAPYFVKEQRSVYFNAK